MRVVKASPTLTAYTACPLYPRPEKEQYSAEAYCCEDTDGNYLSREGHTTVVWFGYPVVQGDGEINDRMPWLS